MDFSSLPSNLAIVVVAIVTTAVAIFFLAKTLGKSDAEREQAEADLNAAKRAKVIEDEITKLKSDDIDKRLDKWMRD